MPRCRIVVSGEDAMLEHDFDPLPEAGDNFEMNESSFEVTFVEHDPVGNGSPDYLVAAKRLA